MKHLPHILASLIVVALLSPAGASAATTQIGQAPPTGIANACDADSAHVQDRSGADVTYVVPSDGVITKWKTQGGTGTGKMALGVYTPTNANLSYIPRAESKAKKIKPGIKNKFKTHIPVHAGEVIGLHVVSGNPDCRYYTGSNDDQDDAMTPAPPVGPTPQSYGFAQVGRRLNVAAVIK
jgi:hypothetical protein